jgi:predicted nucleotidyltransferase
MDSLNTNALLQEVNTALAPLHPHKIVLFGSYADGTAGIGSDLDLLVVLDSDVTPTSFAERARLHSSVSRRLRELRRTVPMDVVVQTRPMYRRFVKEGGMFARDVQENGKVLYEDGHSRVGAALTADVTDGHG